MLGTPGPWEAFAEGEDIGDSTYGHVCAQLDHDPDEVTVTVYSRGTLGADDPAAERYVGERVLVFPDEAGAARAVDQMTASFNGCDQDHIEVRPVSDGNDHADTTRNPVA